MDICVDILRPVILLSLLTVAAVTDVLKHKVSNHIIAMGFIAESAVHILSKPVLDCGQLGYAVLFIIILFMLFALHLMGGADVKLYALCVFTYPNETGLRIICLSVIIGALYALPVLLKQGDIAARYARLFRYIISSSRDVGISSSGNAAIGSSVSAGISSVRDVSISSSGSAGISASEDAAMSPSENAVVNSLGDAADGAATGSTSIPMAAFILAGAVLGAI